MQFTDTILNGVFPNSKETASAPKTWSLLKPMPMSRFESRHRVQQGCCTLVGFEPFASMVLLLG